MMNWMIYGAYGYSGALIVAEAVKRGHKPLLAGRNADKLHPLAEKYDLPWVAFDLDDPKQIEQNLAEVSCVLHCAGPFTFTAAPMRKACLKTGTHYLDITGEINVFEDGFAQDVLARQCGIVMISGVGFDVVPTDSLAVYLKSQLPTATHLEIGLIGGSPTGASVGTTRSALEIISQGNLVRRDGALKQIPLGSGAKHIPFPKKAYLAMPFPWGDLSTAWRSTAIPNITTYLVWSRTYLRMIQATGPLIRQAVRVTPVRRALQKGVGVWPKQSSHEIGVQGQSTIWGRVMDSTGESRQAWLTCYEGYQFTALVSVQVVERVLAESPTGALSPAQFLGSEFVLGIEGTHRLEG
jgi:short subunit dehydrogenase-like uncharacterized protein